MNNALFLTMGTMVADAEFSHLLEPELRPKLYAAMHKAMQGNAKRGLDFHGDNMHESYSNVRPFSRVQLMTALPPPLRMYRLRRKPRQRQRPRRQG